jgi:hypothetical protein
MALDPAKLAEIKARAAAAVAARGGTIKEAEMQNAVRVVPNEKQSAEQKSVTQSVPASAPALVQERKASLPAPLDFGQQVISRIGELQTALQAGTPNYEMLLHTIHVALTRDEAVVHLLTEEQIGIICAGLSKRKSVVIAQSAAKGSKAPNGKKLKDLDTEDL